MGRLLAWILGIGLLVLIIGLVVITIAPSGAGELLVFAGLIAVATAGIAASLRAAASKGWSRAWNPGAARREYLAEQEALARKARGTGSPHGHRVDPPG